MESKIESLTHATTLEVRDACLCLHAQRAARALARRFDEALRPFGLTSGQFSILMALNRPHPPTIAEVAPFLAMDRTTLTANLKPLERRCLVAMEAVEGDRRRRRARLLPMGRDTLAAALPIWRQLHAKVESEVADAARLRADLAIVAGLSPGGQ